MQYTTTQRAGVEHAFRLVAEHVEDPEYVGGRGAPVPLDGVVQDHFVGRRDAVLSQDTLSPLRPHEYFRQASHQVIAAEACPRQPDGSRDELAVEMFVGAHVDHDQAVILDVLLQPYLGPRINQMK